MFAMIYALLLLALALFVRADNWHLDNIALLTVESLDPIVSPNDQSTHIHRVIGGSGFGASYDYQSYASSKCSSLAPQADKSNYWMPSSSLHPAPKTIRD